MKGIDFVDLSIPKAHPVKVEDDLQLAREIQDRIRASDVLLVFAGMYVNFSEWVKLETLCAFFDHCPIIAVAPNGQERVAATATKFANRTVRWRGDSIRNAVWDVLPESRRTEISNARRQSQATAVLPPRRPLPVGDPFAGSRSPNGQGEALASDVLLDLYRKK